MGGGASRANSCTQIQKEVAVSVNGLVDGVYELAFFRNGDWHVQVNEARQLVNTVIMSGGIAFRAESLLRLVGLRDMLLEHRRMHNRIDVHCTDLLCQLVRKVVAVRGVQYLLVSAPEHTTQKDLKVLEHAQFLVKKIGFDNVAGDAKDKFHQHVMDPARMTRQRQAWRDAWLGKVCTAIQQVQRFCPGQPLVLMTIDGGPECQWELQKLKDRVLVQFSAVSIEQCKDFDAFVDYFASMQ